jgi:CspA family cold shock protein
MTIGTVFFFNSWRGFGFISPDGGGEDVFVNLCAVAMSSMCLLTEGARVSFDVQTDVRGRQAVNLQAA